MSWWKKAGQALNDAGDAIAKPVYKAGDYIAKNTGLDKVEAPSLSVNKNSLSNLLKKRAQSKNKSVLDRVGDAIASGAQSVGDFFNETLSGTSNRKPTVKSQGPNPLEQDRDMKQPMKDFGPTPGEKKAFEGLTPILQNTPIDNVSIPVIDNIRKVLASGGSGTLAIPEGGEEPLITRPPRPVVTPPRVASGGAAVQGIPIPAPDTDDKVPQGPANKPAGKNAPASQTKPKVIALTDDQPRKASVYSRWKKRMPKRKMVT